MRLSPASSVLALGVLATASAAAAQTAAPAAPTPTPSLSAPEAPASEAVSELIVVGERPAVVTSIDRKAYNVSRDLSSTTGSVADAMRNLPSVDVDVDGNISLRGESSVQILIDGKPSAMFSGDNRAQALQQLPANSVDRIEVITNPSAEFSPDGTGGVINIITKKNRKMGPSGSVQAGVGPFGRFNLNGLANYRAGKLNLTGSLGVRHVANPRANSGENTRIDPILGERTVTTFQSANRSEFDSINSSGTAEYDISDNDRLTFNASFFAGQAESSGISTDVRRDGVGVVTRDFDTITRGESENQNIDLSTSWRHAFATEGRSLTLTTSYSVSDRENLNRTRYVYRTPVDGREEERFDSEDSSDLELSANFVTPIANGGSLKFGYEFEREVEDENATGLLIDPVGGGPTNLPNVTNRFVVADSNHQAYATYQRPFGKLTVLAGLRLELASIADDQRTTAVSGDNEYFDVHPSLHLQYELTENQNLSASYSHRVRRPGGWQLNPFLVVNDEFSARAGNPNLRPQETHSVEAGWQWQESGRSAGATIYYRQNYNVIGPVNEFLTPTLVLNTFENQGESRSGGVELDLGGPIGERLSYRANANISYNEIQRSSFAGGGTDEAFAYTVKGNLDYKPTEKDMVQLTVNYSGKQIFAQGYRLPSGSANIGYQRKFRQDLIGTLSISDIFSSQRWGTVTDTPTLFGTSTSEPRGRTISIGITRLFGGRQAREAQFDFDAGSSPEE